MHSPWPVHTVVLDVDDTLFAEREFVLSGFAAAGDWLYRERGIGGFAACATVLFSAGNRGRIFDEALAQLGQPADSELVQALLRVYREHRPRLSLLPDARRLLSWLVGRVNVALLTDGFEAVQRNKIAALDLDPRIELRVVTDALGGRDYWKPSPEPYRVVMRHYCGSPAGYVYVADNPRKDFIAPRALGWRTVRIRRPGGEHYDYVASAGEDAETTISDLMELATLIALPTTSS